MAARRLTASGPPSRNVVSANFFCMCATQNTGSNPDPAPKKNLMPKSSNRRLGFYASTMYTTMYITEKFNGYPMQRLPWPEYFMNITYLVSGRSTCTRRRVGAVAVKDKRILATGYNGAPTGVPHCLEVGCLREQMGIPSGQRHEICRGLHAEQNVIIQAAVHGINISGSELYCTTHPCVQCCKMLINCGIRRIYYAEHYPDELATTMFKEAGVQLERLDFTPPAISPQPE